MTPRNETTLAFGGLPRVVAVGDRESARAIVMLLHGFQMGPADLAPLPFLDAGPFRGMSVLVSHGMSDPNLSFAAGTALKDCLAEAGASVTWVPFEQGHEIPLVVWRRLRKFVERFL